MRLSWDRGSKGCEKRWDPRDSKLTATSGHALGYEEAMAEARSWLESRT